jgi:hypothetical protein
LAPAFLFQGRAPLRKGLSCAANNGALRDVKEPPFSLLVMYQVKNKEFVLKISEKLKNASLIDNSADSRMLKEIISEIDTDANTDSWKDLKSAFSEFTSISIRTSALNSRDLTANEFHTCAFLKLNMSTKDIASITYQLSTVSM